MIETKFSMPTKVTLVFERTQLGWDEEHAKQLNITIGERRRDHYDVFIVVETRSGTQKIHLDYGIEYMEPGGRIEQIAKPVIEVEVRDRDCVDKNAPPPASRNAEMEPIQLRFAENGLQILGKEGKQLAAREQKLEALKHSLEIFSEEVDEFQQWIATRPTKKHICLACDRECDQTKICIPCVTDGWYLDDSNMPCLDDQGISGEIPGGTD